MKAYLETSFISACVTQRTDSSSLHRRKKSLLWWSQERRQYDLLISDEVLTELANPRHRERKAARAFVENLTVLPVTQEVYGLARIFITEKVMPSPLGGDAVHVALATLARVEYILSWNVQHLANPNKRAHLAKICLRLGLIPPIIVTPEFLLGATP